MAVIDIGMEIDGLAITHWYIVKIIESVASYGLMQLHAKAAPRGQLNYYLRRFRCLFLNDMKF